VWGDEGVQPLIVDSFGSRFSVSHWRLKLDSKLNGLTGEWEPRQFPYDSIVFLTHSGNVSLDALRWLSQHKVPVFVLDWRGRLQASIVHGQPIQGALHLRQYQTHLDTAKRREIGLAILREKVRQSKNE
jgi:CRISPR/Cas system-associated endonuclease Cas1